MAIREHKHAGRQVSEQPFGLFRLALGERPRVRADLHHRRHTRLRERRTAARRSRQPEPLAVARLVGQVQRRAVEGHETQPPVPCAGRPGTRQRGHAAVAKRQKRRRAQPRPRPRDRGLARDPHRKVRRYPPKAVDKAAQDLAGRDRPEQRHRDHVVDHHLGRKVAPPPAVAAQGPQRRAHRQGGHDAEQEKRGGAPARRRLLDRPRRQAHGLRRPRLSRGRRNRHRQPPRQRRRPDWDRQGSGRELPPEVRVRRTSGILFRMPLRGLEKGPSSL